MDSRSSGVIALPDGPQLQNAVGAANETSGPRTVPGRVIPVPASVSPAMQETIAMPYRDSEWRLDPPDAEGWRQAVAGLAAHTIPAIEKIRDRLGVRVEPVTVAGVGCFEVHPSEIAPANADRLLVNTHGGGYVFNPGEACLLEAIVLAATSRIKVIAVDYRMPPDHPFPAAVEDAFAVWSSLVASHAPDRVALSGGSSGGGLAMATVLRAKREGVPLPAALAIQSPWADLDEVGDSLRTNEWLDSVLVTYGAGPTRAAALYANGHDRGDPLLAPLRGDLSCFPPTILLTGTRDLFLSLTVLVHRKLRKAGVAADLHVVEGASHFQYFINPFAAESQDVLAEIASFLDRHMR